MRSLDQIIKAYDVRGIYPDQLDSDLAHAVGAAFVQVLGIAARDGGPGVVVIGHDMRPSGPELVSAFADGVREQGCDVILIGLASTDGLYFASGQLNIPGAMFTASHNPAQYNGIKLCRAGAAPVGQDSGLREIREMIENDAIPSYDGPMGEISEQDMLTEYAKYLRQLVDISGSRPLKVVVDAGNGMGGFTVPAVLGTGCGLPALPLEIDALYFELDGTFPNHHPDPADPHNLEDLIRCVQSTDCEIGLAFDGDGDRLGVVTKSGEIIWPDRQLILYARDVLSRCPGETIIYDVKCSRHVAVEIRKAGGVPLMCQTGHSLIKAKLAETGAPLAGEMSGHTFFKERWYGFDDGLYTGARLLEILSRSANASAVLEGLPQGVSTPELKIEMKEGEPHAVIERLQREAKFAGSTELITIDGVRAEYADGFGLARASNTTPVIVLRFEGDTPEALARIQDAFRAELKLLAPHAHLPF
ncbi:phosphomannomutase/phosphoglucomutase [Aestuariivirga sp.]|uniref:phosphomannomutase/phosphoglucomutase n=1 Tax=Aestuariivirga sp. TaxID=2650926 RepID=UPI00301A87D4